jgi:hypothetical protein
MFIPNERIKRFVVLILVICPQALLLYDRLFKEQGHSCLAAATKPTHELKNYLVDNQDDIHLVPHILATGLGIANSCNKYVFKCLLDSGRTDQRFKKIKGPACWIQQCVFGQSHHETLVDQMVLRFCVMF